GGIPLHDVFRARIGAPHALHGGLHDGFHTDRFVVHFCLLFQKEGKGASRGGGGRPRAAQAGREEGPPYGSFAAASSAEMSIFFIVIIASKTRFAFALSGLVLSSRSRAGVICQEKPQRSLHQPHWLSSPPLETIAFQ